MQLIEDQKGILTAIEQYTEVNRELGREDDSKVVAIDKDFVNRKLDQLSKMDLESLTQTIEQQSVVFVSSSQAISIMTLITFLKIFCR